MTDAKLREPAEAGEKKWQCLVCGYVHKGTQPPERCPVCGASQDRFVVLDD
ncbi:MAG: hypothetical protein M0Z41_11935 [Peptococcaceae bacterium]|jgi:rubrerythrin|nr:hypothetical protein [Peptococcaceae bacterium]